jgi:hypothetical protein
VKMKCNITYSQGGNEYLLYKTRDNVRINVRNIGRVRVTTIAVEEV